MTRIILACALTLVGTSAWAAKNEVSVEGGAVGIGADSFATVAPGRAMPTWGIRGGYAVHDRVALFGSLHTGQRGQRLIIGADTDAMRTAYNATTLTLGAKVDYTVEEILAPYASAGLLLHHGLLRLDDDPSRRDNPGQVMSSAASFGGTIMVGTDFRFLPGEDIQPAIHIEVGWQGVLSHDYLVDGETVMPLGYSGPVAHAGVGVRF